MPSRAVVLKIAKQPLHRMESEGAVLATVEMLIFETLKVARGGKFKAILPLLRK